MRKTKSSTVRARKEHQCNACRSAIKIGELHWTRTEFEKKPVTVRECVICFLVYQAFTLGYWRTLEKKESVRSFLGPAMRAVKERYGESYGP